MSGLSHSPCSLVLTKPSWNICRLFRMLLRGFWLKSTKCSWVTRLVIRLHWIPINVTLRFWCWPLELCMGKHHTIVNVCVHISAVRSWGHMITTCWFYAIWELKERVSVVHRLQSSLPFLLWITLWYLSWKLLNTFILRGWWLMTSSTDFTSTVWCHIVNGNMLFWD